MNAYTSFIRVVLMASLLALLGAGCAQNPAANTSGSSHTPAARSFVPAEAGCC